MKIVLKYKSRNNYKKFLFYLNKLIYSISLLVLLLTTTYIANI